MVISLSFSSFPASIWKAGRGGSSTQSTVYFFRCGCNGFLLNYFLCISSVAFVCSHICFQNELGSPKFKKTMA